MHARFSSLFGFGVDNRYTQKDIEELSKAFTGWTIRKAWPGDVKPFPQSAREPFIDVSAQYKDISKIQTGRVWRYFRGKKEPSGKRVGNDTILLSNGPSPASTTHHGCGEKSVSVMAMMTTQLSLTICVTSTCRSTCATHSPSATLTNWIT